MNANLDSVLAEVRQQHPEETPEQQESRARYRIEQHVDRKPPRVASPSTATRDLEKLASHLTSFPKAAAELKAELRSLTEQLKAMDVKVTQAPSAAPIVTLSSGPRLSLRESRRWLAVIVALLMLLLGAIAAKAEPDASGLSASERMRLIHRAMTVEGDPQQPSGLILQLRNQGTVLTTRPAGLLILNCSTNMSCSMTGSTFNITSSSTASTAFSALTASLNTNVGTFSASGNSWDFTAATIFKLRAGAALTTSAAGDLGYDTTAGRWHGFIGAADRLFIGSTNVGVAGQAALSNADGTFTFADPIVSGPAAEGAAPVNNPVWVAGKGADGFIHSVRMANDGTVRVDPTGTTTQPVSGPLTDTQLRATPVAVAGGKTNNAAAPGATNVGSLGCVATAAAPALTEGFQVGCSMDLAGNQRVSNAAADTVGTLQALGALNAAASVALAGQQGASIFIAAGTLAGTVVAEYRSESGAPWTQVKFFNANTNAIVSSVVFTNPNPATELQIFGVPSGASAARVRVSAFTSGTANATATASMTQSPRTMTTLYSAAGTEIGTAAAPARVDPTGTTTQPISAASLPLPTGAASEATLSALNTKIPASPATDRATAAAPFSARLSDGAAFYKATTPTDTQPVRGVGAVVADSVAVRCVNAANTAFESCAGAGGSGGTSSTDQAAFTAGATSGTPTMGARDDTTPSTLAEDTLGIARMTTNRALHTNLRDAAGTELGVAAAPIRTDPTGTTTQPVSLAAAIDVSDRIGRLLGQIVGTVASGAADSGNPVKVGGVFNTTQPTVTNGQRVDAQFSARGEMLIAKGPSGFSIDNTSFNVGTFPDNEPFNVAQINGVAPLMGNGVTGTGSPRVTVASDNTPFGVKRSDGTNTAVVDPCQDAALTRTSFNVSQTAGAQIIAGTASKQTYLCNLFFITATTQNVALVEGTGTVCATGIAGMMGGSTAATGQNWTASQGFVQPATGYWFAKTATAANNVCLLQSGTGQISGGGSYVQK